MSKLFLIVGLPAVLLLLGCQANTAARREIALLKAEILDLEDQYYAIKSEYKHATGREPSSRSLRSNSSIYLEDACDDVIIDEGSSSMSDVVYPGQSGNGVQRRRFGFPQQPNNQTQQPMEEIEIHSPENFRYPLTLRQNQPTNSRAATANSTDSSRSSVQQVSFLETDPHSQISNVARIEIAKNISGGYRLSESGTDEGIYLFVQLLDQAGRPTVGTGRLLVSLMDHQLPAEQQRVGFWRIDSDEIQTAFSELSDEKPGIDFYLPWSQSVPQNDQLRLYVRWIGESGDVANNQVDIAINAVRLEKSDFNASQNTDQSPAKSGSSRSGTPEKSRSATSLVDSAARVDSLWQPNRN